MLRVAKIENGTLSCCGLSSGGKMTAFVERAGLLWTGEVSFKNAAELVLPTPNDKGQLVQYPHDGRKCRHLLNPKNADLNEIPLLSLGDRDPLLPARRGASLCRI
jgi:hypothetical protein